MKPPIISNFDINRYLGKWYQIAAVPLWFQWRLKDVTAQYDLNPDGTIRVENNGTGEITGLKQNIVGSARIPNRQKPNQLKVKFRFGESDYYVIDTDYNYALVGGESPNALWILSRTPKKIPQTVLRQYIEKAKKLGYNTQRLRYS